MKNALLLCLGLGGLAQALEVHEWGTFTVLSRSEGYPVSWYQPGSDLAALPDFVGTTGAKFGVARVRMETPVIYFYPEKPQHVTVTADFLRGRITESFPFVKDGGGLGVWSGNLFPPDDTQALSLIPEITDPHPDEPYGAARDVPDAWIFRSDVTKNPFSPKEALPPQAEKFIFYRGSGETTPPLSTGLSDDGTISIRNYGSQPVLDGVALHVSGGLAAWKELPDLPAKDSSGKAGEILVKPVDTPRPVAEVEAELAAHWTRTLVRQGLTPDEAAAMVATWRATWFREPGTRVLSIVPSEFIGKNLPLDISPEPKKLVRVFVARHEIISPEKENRLVDLLNLEEPATAGTRAKLEALELGRFANGAAGIAASIQSYRMRQRFALLRALPVVGETSSR